MSTELHKCVTGIAYHHDRGPNTMGRYHGGRRTSSDDSFHSPTIIPPSALDKPSSMKHYHHRRTTRWGVTARSPMMVRLHDTRFVACWWWNDGWTVKTVVTWWSPVSMIPAPGPEYQPRVENKEESMQQTRRQSCTYTLYFHWPSSQPQPRHPIQLQVQLTMAS